MKATQFHVCNTYCCKDGNHVGLVFSLLVKSVVPFDTSFVLTDQEDYSFYLLALSDDKRKKICENDELYGNSTENEILSQLGQDYSVCIARDKKNESRVSENGFFTEHKSRLKHLHCINASEFHRQYKVEKVGKRKNIDAKCCWIQIIIVNSKINSLNLESNGIEKMFRM